MYLEDCGRFYVSQGAYRTAFIMHRTRNGQRKTIAAKYSPVKRASSLSQDCDVTRLVLIRKRPHLANVVPYAKVHNFFLLPLRTLMLLLLITHDNLTNISHDPLNASRRAIKTGMFRRYNEGRMIMIENYSATSTRRKTNGR